MKLFGRRKTFAVAAGAPLAMAAGMSTKANPRYLPPPPTIDFPQDGILGRVVTPPKWRDFCEARDAFHKQEILQHEVHNTHVFDLNIQALRSVSAQHKARMQIESHRRAQCELETFLESIARQLNVWDFWKGREADKYADNASQASRY